MLEKRLQRDVRTNRYNPETDMLTISDVRAEAIKSNMDYYERLFTDDPEFADLREAYAMPENTIKDDERMDKMSAQKPPELLSTHPASRNRMEELRAMLPEMERLYRKAPVQYGLGVRLPEVSPTAASDRAASASP